MWYEIWVEWNNGSIEKIDSTDGKADADYLEDEYGLAYGPHIKRIWVEFG